MHCKRRDKRGLTMSANMGRVVQVIGPVVDIEFPPEQLPDLLTAIRIEGKRRARR